MKLLKSRIFYIFCFFALNIVDWLSQTLYGHIGDVAANMGGVVIILLALSGTHLKKKRKSAYILWTVVCFVLVGIWMVWFFSRPQPCWVFTPLSGYLNIYLFGILFISLAHRPEIRGIKNRITVLGVLWVVFSILVLLSKNEIIWPFWYLLIVGCFYSVRFDEKKKKLMMDGMIDGTILSFFVMQIYAYGFRPYDRRCYFGYHVNVNIQALHYLVVFCMLLVKIYILENRKAPKWEKMLTVFLAGGLVSFQIFTLCRTALIVSGMLVIIYGVAVEGFLQRKRLLQIVTRGAVFLACVLVTIPLVFLTIRYLPTVLHHPVWYSGEYSVDKVHSFDPADSPKYTSWDEFTEVAYEKYMRIFGIIQLKNSETEEEIVEKPPRPFSGRGEIYKIYCSDLNFSGHKNSYVDCWDLPEYASAKAHAHNLWIQVAFFWGIPAGVLLIIMELLILIRNVRTIRQNRNDPYSILPLFVSVVFFSFGMMDMVWLYGQFILNMVFLVQHPQMNGKFRNIETEKKKLDSSGNI